MASKRILVQTKKTSVKAAIAVLKRKEIKNYWKKFFKTVLLITFLIVLSVFAIKILFFTEVFFAVKVSLSILYLIITSHYMVETVILWIE